MDSCSLCALINAPQLGMTLLKFEMLLMFLSVEYVSIIQKQQIESHVCCTLLLLVYSKPLERLRLSKNGLIFNLYLMVFIDLLIHLKNV